MRNTARAQKESPVETTFPAESKETGHSPDRIYAGKVCGLQRYTDTEGQGKPYELYTTQPVGGPYTILLVKSLETSRLIFRSWQKSDKDSTLSLWDNKESGRYMSDPVRESMGEAYLKRVDEMGNNPEGYYLLAGRKANTMPVETYYVFPESGSYDIEYCITKEYWKGGLGTKMVNVILRWMKAEGGRSVVGEVADNNLLSIALLHRFGSTGDRKTCYRKWGEETYFGTHYRKLSLGGLPISLQR